jgi:hypothetical protein
MHLPNSKYIKRRNLKFEYIYLQINNLQINEILIFNDFT